MARPLDAATIVGLLADDDRRKVFAALELGSTTVDQVVAVTSLPPARVAKAAGRLADAGLVEQIDGGLYVLGAGGQPQLRQVRLGRAEGGRVEVLSGVAAGEAVLTEPQTAARAR